MTDKPNIPPRKPGEGTRDYRKRISDGSYKNKPQAKGNDRFKGLTDDQIRAKIAAEDAERAKEAKETKLDQDPELNKQQEDMRQGDFLQDPERSMSFKNRDILKIIGTGLGGIRPYQQAGGALFRALTIQQLGGYR